MKFNSLGPLTVAHEGREVSLPPAPRRVLASLLLEPDSVVSAERLIDWVWGEAMPATARNTLQAHVAELRRRLPGVVESADGGYRLDLSTHDSDRSLFEQLTAAAARFTSEGHFEKALPVTRRAIALWRGDPFPELANVSAAQAERVRLRHMLMTLREARASTLIGLGRLTEAIELLGGWTVESPLHEPFWEQLMSACYFAGRQADALAAYREASRVLAEELGIDPGPRLRELEDRILMQDDGLSVSPSPTPHNLPIARTSFVGRADDLARLAELVMATPVVTVVGGPGLGKSRLAGEVGLAVRHRFPGGVWLVRLVGATTEADVSATIAATVGLTDNVASLEQLHRILSPRPTLLILDNCEQVLEPLRSFLIQETATDPLRILATSRACLGVPGERIWRLQPLAVPVEGILPWDSPAGRLFADRVAALDVSPPIESMDPAGVAELCRRTGGVPLALELAARWVPALGLDEVSRVTLEPPPGPPASPTPHHASLAAAIGWSTQALREPDRSAFYSASVFAGSFGLEAFRQVCLSSTDATTGSVTAARLVDASLMTIERDDDGRARYRMLEPLRDFGAATMGTGDRHRSVRDLHAAWMVSRAREVAALAKGPEEAAALRSIDAELADFRAAMRHLLDEGRPEDAAIIATALSRFWFARYLGWEAQLWLDECLAGTLDTGIRGETLTAAGWAAYTTGSYGPAERHYEEALALARVAGDRRRAAESLYGLARIHLPRRFRDGAALLEEALSLFEATGAELEAAECRLWVGLRAANAGDVAVAVPALTEATAVMERLGYHMKVSVGRRYLSLAAWHAGDEGTARSHVEAAEQVARSTDDKRAIGGALIQRALVEGRWGDPAAAAEALIEALRPIPGRSDIDFCLVAYGALPVLISQGSWVLAGRLLHHLDRVYDEYGWTPLDQRMPATTGFRAAVAEGLAVAGLRLAPESPTSAEMAQELTAALGDIALTRSARTSG